MTAGSDAGRDWQLRVKVDADLRTQVRALARRRHISLSQLVRSLISLELSAAEQGSGSQPDESAVREMAILIAVELGLKLQELSLPGGATRSRQLLEEAARAAMERVDMVEASLQRVEK